MWKSKWRTSDPLVAEWMEEWQRKLRDGRLLGTPQKSEQHKGGGRRRLEFPHLEAALLDAQVLKIDKLAARVAHVIEFHARRGFDIPESQTRTLTRRVVKWGQENRTK